MIEVDADPVYADKRTVGRCIGCGWEIARRVVAGCRLGRVVFRRGAVQVNSRLGSLGSVCREMFATETATAGKDPEGVPTRPYQAGTDVVATSAPPPSA